MRSFILYYRQLPNERTILKRTIYRDFVRLCVHWILCVVFVFFRSAQSNRLSYDAMENVCKMKRKKEKPKITER